MKLLLATSPHVRHAAVLQNDFAPDASAMYSFAPVGLLSLLAVLRRDRPGVEGELYDLNRRIAVGAIPLGPSFYDEVASDICGRAADIVGFMTECDSYHHVLQIAEAIKRRRPSCGVILGGPHASAVAGRTLECCAAVDAVVIGEAELTLPDLLDSLADRSDREVAGSVRRVRSMIVDGGQRPLIERLDDLPIPAYDLHTPTPGEELFVEVGRGCPFKCEFCSTAPYWKRRHRVKTPARVGEEVTAIRRLFDVSRIHLVHDLLTTDRAWVEEVCRELIRIGAPVRWTCSARTDTVDRDLLGLMRRAGCDAIYFGIESGSQVVLRAIRKDIPLDHSFAMLGACRDQGVTPNAGFIVGFPCETDASLRETLAAFERALRIGCRPTHVFAYCPFADSSMYSTLKGLRCTGHFVDLPLGAGVDQRNRELVASDQRLFGAYFRPSLPELVPGQDNAIDAVDEFSPLVEAVIVPTLALAERCGGMYEVFCRWLRWVRAYNDARAAQVYRRSYGTVVAFATFILDELRSYCEPASGPVTAARAVLLNVEIAERAKARGAVSMASYRSLALPTIESECGLTLGTRLSLGYVMDTAVFDYDVLPALRGDALAEFVSETTHLAWQLMPDGAVRLLRIDRTVFAAIDVLRRNSCTTGDLYMARWSRDRLSEFGAAEDLDAQAMLAALSAATREGLIRTVED